MGYHQGERTGTKPRIRGVGPEKLEEPGAQLRVFTLLDINSADNFVSMEDHGMPVVAFFRPASRPSPLMKGFEPLAVIAAAP